MGNEIHNKRKKIDKLDAEIVELLAEREKTVQEILIIKKENNTFGRDPKRESEVLGRVMRIAGDRLPPWLLDKIYRAIFAYSEELARS